MTLPLPEHQAFLDRYYGWSRPIYDLTRKHYLAGRDPVLDALAGEPWGRLLEIGPGTGRNLRVLRARRPDAVLGGIEPALPMLHHARRAAPWATIVHGFAETADLTAPIGRPDRILFSYSLSMIRDADTALARARAALAPGGEVVVVDFGDVTELAPLLARPLRRFLAAFHVTPLDTGWLAARGARLRFGPARYWVEARFGATS